MNSPEPLIDSFGRVHRDLRISVTDRCNIRCRYCMPHEDVRFKPRSELLTFEEIEQFVRVVAGLGVTKLRITGGEPLLRAQLPKLIAALAGIPGIADIAMTTNGLLLAEHARDLRQAGLQRLNVSLDALDGEAFRQITRRDGVQRVLNGIAAARDAGFENIRLNAVAIRGITESQIVPLARFAREQGLELRFIEFMPLDADQNWRDGQVLSGAEVRSRLEDAFGPLVPAARTISSQPAVDYCFPDGSGQVGFINAVTVPFCEQCNRLRLTAEGQMRHCLFSTEEWDARAVLRGGHDEELAALVRACVGAKKAARGNDQPVFVRPQRAMFQIGG
jgi:cyclic pyranopterin phosphate synthase